MFAVEDPREAPVGELHELRAGQPGTLLAPRVHHVLRRERTDQRRSRRPKAELGLHAVRGDVTVERTEHHGRARASPARASASVASSSACQVFCHSRTAWLARSASRQSPRRRPREGGCRHRHGPARLDVGEGVTGLDGEAETVAVVGERHVESSALCGDVSLDQRRVPSQRRRADEGGGRLGSPAQAVEHLEVDVQRGVHRLDEVPPVAAIVVALQALLDVAQSVQGRGFPCRRPAARRCSAAPRPSP